jgi:chromosome segregation ATPase
MDSLRIQMNGIASDSRQCQEAAEAMQLRFTQWLHFVMELHEACQEAQGHNEVKFSEASSKETAAKVLEKERVKTQQKQEEVAKKMEKLLDEDHEAYTKTLKEYPDGYVNARRYGHIKICLLMFSLETLS